jgi:serine/threonine protein phosphatase PrpC
MDIEPRTTCVLCLVQNGYAYWAHVGDSRLYHLRGTQVLARTQDHTSLEQWREEGLVTEAEMGEHPTKGRLLRCLGSVKEPAIDVGQETTLQRGDTLLLCSDGLWEALSTEEIARHANRPALEEGIEEMLLAVERKRKAASDNISVVALRWDDAMPKALPLQGNPAGQVAPSALVREGARAAAGRKPAAAPGKAATPAGKPPAPNDSLDQRIEELEKYLSRFEPRPKRENH